MHCVKIGAETLTEIFSEVRLKVVQKLWDTKDSNESALKIRVFEGRREGNKDLLSPQSSE